VRQSLAISDFNRSRGVKVRPVSLAGGPGYTHRCLVACEYFVSREVVLQSDSASHGYMQDQTGSSCIILTSLGANLLVYSGDTLELCEPLARGQTMVLPAALGRYRIEGEGKFIFSYVPEPGDEAWAAWKAGQE